MSSEYDISVDADEPLQVISFVPDRRRSSKAFNAVDSAEREVASFTLGKGKADWGPLTIYAVMKNGDVYAVCPYMPKNAYVGPCLNSVSSDSCIQVDTLIIHPFPRVLRSGQARIPLSKPVVRVSITIDSILLST
jgi:hypothetical protein